MKKQLSALAALVWFLPFHLQSAEASSSRDHVTLLTDSPFARRLLTNPAGFKAPAHGRGDTLPSNPGTSILSVGQNNQVGRTARGVAGSLDQDLIPVFPDRPGTHRETEGFDTGDISRLNPFGANPGPAIPALPSTTNSPPPTTPRPPDGPPLALPTDPALPGAAPALPSQAPALPGAAPALPDQPPALPGAPPALPSGALAVPGASPALPGAAPALPSSQPALPGTRPRSSRR